MKGVILVASQFRMQRFLDMLWGTYVSIYWRKFGVFLWLDHWEQGCELGAMWLDEIGRQSGWSFFGLLGMSRGPFIGQGREREGMNEQEWPAMKVLQIDH
jgi:hypothetical protein